MTVEKNSKHWQIKDQAVDVQVVSFYTMGLFEIIAVSYLSFSFILFESESFDALIVLIAKFADVKI